MATESTIWQLIAHLTGPHLNPHARSKASRPPLDAVDFSDVKGSRRQALEAAAAAA
ncbi:MAG: hypothetical protein ACLR56_07595 [Oscillospiraceae bacterium]